MMALDFQTVAQVSTARALNTIVEGVALAGLSWVVLRFGGGRSAVTRFAVWFSTLLVVVSLPLFVSVNGARALHRPELEISSAWATDLFIIWAAIASIMLLRLAGSLRQVWRLRQRCEAMDLEKYPELAETARQCSSARNVKLLVSDELRVPTALGFFQPAVVLPAWALSELSSEELRVVLLHELAHLRRWDDWTNLAQKLLKAIFFFHPAVWWIESRLALEREMACDDLVLEQTANPHGYAASLVSLAEKAFASKVGMQKALALAQSALGQVRQISRRLAQILDPSRTRAKRTWHPALGVMALAGVVVFLLTPYAPEMIAFQQPALSASRFAGSSAVTSVRTPSPIRASFVAGRVGEGRAVAATHSPSSHRAVLTAEPRIVPARARTHNSIKPKLVLAKAEAAATAEQVLLVLQSSQTDASGSTSWTLCVWRTQPDSGQMSKVEEIVISSI